MQLSNIFAFGKRNTEKVEVINADVVSDERPYKCIPLFTKKEMKNAKVVSDEKIVQNYIKRQATNGYAGLYKGKWVIGRNEHGEIKNPKRICYPKYF